MKKNSQVSYETGKTAPTIEYLYRLASHDIDIGYLLTGRRDDGSQANEERLLIDMFGKLGAREREAISTRLAIMIGNPLAMDSVRIERSSDTLHAPRQTFKGERDG